MEDKGLKIYTMDTEELADTAFYQKCYSSLSDRRQEKADSYHFSADMKLSVGAGLLLDRGLNEYGLRESEVRIGLGENGKPYLLDYPEIHYNLAHSGNMVLAVFADTEVGCDIEQIKTADLKVAKRFFCADEYAYIASLEEEEQAGAFCRIWTLKESFLKATGMGMKLPLDSFAFQFSSESLEVTVRQHYDRNHYRFLEYDFGKYYAAICLKEIVGY